MRDTEQRILHGRQHGGFAGFVRSIDDLEIVPRRREGEFYVGEATVTDKLEFPDTHRLEHFSFNWNHLRAAPRAVPVRLDRNMI